MPDPGGMNSITHQEVSQTLVASGIVFERVIRRRRVEGIKVRQHNRRVVAVFCNVAEWQSKRREIEAILLQVGFNCSTPQGWGPDVIAVTKES